MNVEAIKTKFKASNIFHSDDKILNSQTVIGYEKLFKWSWMATQLNTFIVVTDLGDEELIQLTEIASNKVFQTADAKEGPLAFVEKRKPNWKGR